MALVFLGTLFVFGVFRRRNNTLEELLETYRAERTQLYSVVRKLYYENRELSARISALEQLMNVNMNIQYSTVETQVSPSSSFTEDSSDTNTSAASRAYKKQLWPFHVIT